jgi:VIT1/CCC1 family predicted Fe2+/Mn2+ transporter
MFRQKNISVLTDNRPYGKACSVFESVGGVLLFVLLLFLVVLALLLLIVLIVLVVLAVSVVLLVIGHGTSPPLLS